MSKCKVWKNSNGSFSYQFRVRSKKLNSALTKTFDNKTDGKAWVEEQKRAIRQGHLSSFNQKTLTVAGLIDLFIKETFHNRRSINGALQTLSWWKSRIGELSLSEISKHLIKREWLSIEKIPSGKTGKLLTNRTINSYLETFSACLSWAVSEDLLESNPCLSLRRKSLNNSRERILSEDELTKLLLACKKSSNRYLYAAVLLSLATGGRRGEVLGLHWTDVNLNTGEIRFRNTKNGQPRTAIIGARVLNELAEVSKIRSLTSNLIFAPLKTRTGGMYSTPWEDMTAPFRRACKEANISGFRWHDLRHAAAAFLLMSGASISEMMKILGHKSPAMTWRYAAIDQKRTRELSEEIERRYLSKEN